MASVFKPVYTVKLADGTRAKRKARHWYVRFKNGDGIVQTVKTEFTSADKTLAMCHATELERKARARRAGLAGPFEDQARRPVREHLGDFLAALQDRQRSAVHVHVVGAQLRAILDGIGARTVADLRPSRVEAFLGDLGEKGRSGKTLAHYVGAAKEFSRWLVRDRRIAEDPLASLETYSAATDRRLVRRALDADEQRRLLSATEASVRSSFGLTAHERPLLYRLALTTGLRAHELATLTPSAFDFGTSPTVTVEAKNAKNRKRETLPLLPDVAEAIRAHVGIRPSDEAVWPKTTWPLHAARMMRPDLAAAGIPFEVDGTVVDFHALRHSFITGLARAGVPPQIAQRLARHSDVRLTLGVYSHLGLVDLAGAVAKLPDLTPAPDSAVATGTAGPEVPVGGSSPLALQLALASAKTCKNVLPRETRDPEKQDIGIARGASAGAPVRAAARDSKREEVGAGDGVRTHDTQLGKLVFYH